MPAFQLYEPRQPRRSPLWRCVRDHVQAFLVNYDRQHQSRLGPLRSIVAEVLERFLACGDLHRGFARVRCPDCRLEYLLAFSCKTRGFCPSCQQRRTVETAQFLVADVFAKVPHRHYVLSLPVALRGFFQRDRDLLKALTRLAHESLTEYLRVTLDAAEDRPGIVLALHTFGDYLNFHPHLHAIVTDGLFDRQGVFHQAPEPSLRPLRDLFRAKVFRLLVERKRVSPALVHKFYQWKHSGFNLFRGEAIPGGHRAELESLAQYILRHALSVEKLTYIPHSGRVVYHSKMNQTTRRNFEVFTATDFLAAVTQHIPDKAAQTVKYYGYYSNKSRGQRAKRANTPALPASGPNGCAPVSDRAPMSTAGLPQPVPAAVRHRRIPSRTWRELIKRVWNVDPLVCPKCGSQMRLIALIEDDHVIEDILRHLDLWDGPSRPTGRAPPAPFRLEYTREPCYEDASFGPELFAE